MNASHHRLSVLAATVSAVIAVAAVTSAGTARRHVAPLADPRQQTQGRAGVADRRATPTVKGTAVLRGSVVNAETGRPLTHATVTAVADGVRKTTRTDDNGQFQFVALPSGRYRVHASQVGFVPLDFGEDPDAGGGRDISLTNGEKFVKADFRLPRGGVIAGNVVDEAGEPIEGVQVQAMAVEHIGGADRLVPVATPMTIKRTNDVGRYRIFGLQPGEYYVAATTGAFNADAPVNGDMASGYVVTFFPGCADLASAQQVTVGAARDTAADFALVASRTFELSGLVTGPAGEPLPGAGLVLAPGTGATVGLTASVSAGGDGSFRFSGLGPGPYVLQALYEPPESPPFVALRAPRLFAWMPITITANTAGVVLQARPGWSGRAQIVFEGGQPPADEPSIPTPGRGAPFNPPIEIVPRPFDAARSPMTSATREATINRDWTVDLLDLWGPHTIDAAVPPGWMLKAVRAGAEDMTDAPIDFDRNPGRLQIVMTTRVTEISGTVTDEGHPVAYANVLVFATDASRWDSQSRFLRRAAADENGRFTVSGLPPAEYRVAAPRRVASGNGWKRPQFLESLRRDSIRVMLHEGDHANADLPLSAR